MGGSVSESTSRRITIELPNQFIDHFDQLKREWGLRGRGDVLKRILEEVLPEIDNQEDLQELAEDRKENIQKELNKNAK